MTVLKRIEAERQKQIAKGWTPEHDDGHENGELAKTAASLALRHTDWNTYGDRNPNFILECAKKDRGEVRNLIIAAAFLVAEIERIERLKVR